MSGPYLRGGFAGGGKTALMYQDYNLALNKFKPNIMIIQEKNMIPAKIVKKFYVGKASVVNSDWAHATLADAINHGKRLCEETEDEQIIVQVVRVVRIHKQPVIVETIK